MLPVALVALAYLIGSIPFSFLVVKFVAGKDVRDHGSRNVGATNVARTAGKLPGIFALLLDIAKGYAVIVLARYLVARREWPLDPGVQPWQSPEFWVAGAGLVAVLAHMFPVWLRFHGGKGVATGFGVVLALDPLVALMVVLVFVIVLLAFRFVSLASIVAAAAIPILFSIVPVTPYWWIVMTAGIALAVILKHHENIARLVQGAERKLGRKKEPE